jgi:hypothetical protein
VSGNPSALLLSILLIHSFGLFLAEESDSKLADIFKMGLQSRFSLVKVVYEVDRNFIFN